MTYRILTIILGNHPELPDYLDGKFNATLEREWGDKTNYQPDPEKSKLIFGIPPWGHFYLFEIDAPFPPGANPPSPPDAFHAFIAISGKYIIIDKSSPASDLAWLSLFFDTEFPDQLP